MKAYVDASPAKACVLFEDDTKEIAEAKAKYTNNEAKYRAILLAIHIAKIRRIKLTEIVSDARLVISQLSGKYKVKEPKLKELAEATWKRTGAIYIDGALIKLGEVDFTWVRSQDNPARKVSD